MVSNIIDSFLYISQGIFITIGIASIALFVGFFLGLLMSISRFYRVFHFPITLFISIIRGTPILLQLSFFYFVLPTLLTIQISAFVAGFLTLGINSSAYIAEIFRGGIESIPKGQFEVAKSLGIPPIYMWRDIIFPQVIRAIFPSFISEITVLVKETALVSFIGELDIMRRSQLLAAQNFDYFTPLLIAGIVYYIIVMCIERIGVFFERRMAVCSR